jgi:DNA invertase Pin-like site-specific DNA recombinase|uniref:Resolvase/invertase-type recombinase catalytic domain-containing protein n=1 Tax=viral metagenome TaxID=1070528 RepID=A0A6C0EDE4_9ZZZZ
MCLLKNSIIYTRISTKKQFTGYSLDIQNKICNDYCKKNNLIILDNFKEIKSATNINYQKNLINIIEKYQNINLIISDISRISRNLSNYNILTEKCIQKNIVIHYVEDNLISSNKEHTNIINKKILESEKESQLISFRTKKTIQYKKFINNYNPAILKYGYKYIKVNNKKIIQKNIQENYIIQLIKNLYNFKNDYKKNIKLLSKLISKKKNINELKKKFNIKMIVDFLNKNNILKRNNLWNYNSIYYIIKNY